MFRGIVLRLTAFNAAVIALILLASAVATYVVVSQSLGSDQEAALRQAMNAVDSHTLEEVFHQDVDWSGTPGGSDEGEEDDEEEEHREHSGAVISANGYIVISIEEGALYPSDVQGMPASDFADMQTLRAALNGTSSMGEVESDDEHYRTLTTPVYGESGLLGAVQVGVSDELRRDVLGTLRNSLFLVGMVGLLGAVAGGAVLSARGLRPVREAFDRQRAFIADASHQLKTPVAIVRADAEALQRTEVDLDSDDAQLLEDLLESSVCLSDLVNQLLMVARMEGGQPAAPSALIDLRELAEEATRAMRHVADLHQISLELRSDAEPIPVMGDRTQLRLALLALIDNAIKYNVPHGMVRILVDRADGWGQMAVSDTGIGISDEDREHVWKRFYRSASTRGSSIDGAGLGLSIIRQVVNQHRGEVSLTSAVGKGTEVIVKLRLA